MNRNQIIGFEILRLSLAGVFLWFGFSQLFNSLAWVGIVPDWAVNLLHMPPAFIVLGNGLLEVVLGSLLALGILSRYVALVLALHLFVIAFEMGFSAIGVRDFGLSFATLSVFFLAPRKVELLNVAN
jgi:uncharacterized membrane protein YphA (DoxX/SURF4 family)